MIRKLRSAFAACSLLYVGRLDFAEVIRTFQTAGLPAPSAHLSLPGAGVPVTSGPGRQVGAKKAGFRTSAGSSFGRGTGPTGPGWSLSGGSLGTARPRGFPESFTGRWPGGIPTTGLLLAPLSLNGIAVKVNRDGRTSALPAAWATLKSEYGGVNTGGSDA